MIGFSVVVSAFQFPLSGFRHLFFAGFGCLFASCALVGYRSFMRAVLLVCAPYLLLRLLFCLAFTWFLIFSLGGGMTTCLALGLVLSHLPFVLFCFSCHGTVLTHNWCILCTIYTCMFALLGLLAANTAAGDGSPCLAVCVFVGMFWRTWWCSGPCFAIPC